MRTANGFPDDPIIKCMEKNGVPPWHLPKKSNSYGSGFGGYEDEDWEDEGGDIYYGNETEIF